MSDLTGRPSSSCNVAISNYSICWSNEFCTHVHPAKIERVLVYSPCLFGKKLFSMQDKLVNNKQTHFLKQHFTETITPIDKSCMLLFNI